MRLGTNEFFPQLFPKWRFLGKNGRFQPQKHIKIDGFSQNWLFPKKNYNSKSLYKKLVVKRKSLGNS